MSITNQTPGNTKPTETITSANGSNHIIDGPLTTAAIAEAAPGMLLSEVDSRVVRIRPMATPVDQISRMIGARRAKSMVVEYYSVDTRPYNTTVKIAPSAFETGADVHVFKLVTNNNKVFAATDTIMLPRVEVRQSDGSMQPLVLYVLDNDPDSGLKVMALNPEDPDAVPDIPVGASMVRMGRAAGELDVQTPQFEALPVKSKNYCQIFKTQIEQSTYAKLSAKEVGWTFSDQEEVAIMDMRMGMEKSFLFGTMSRLTDPRKYDDVLFTGGIWNQAGRDIDLDLSELTVASLVSVMREAFTGQSAGSTRKLLLAGSGLIEALNRLDYTKVISAGDTVTRWGIDFSELRSKFGTLYVVHSEVFDQCGHESDGMILDPQYLCKYVHVPFKVQHLDLKSAGLRNTDALVATEASCLVLRHPNAHLRLLGE